MTYMVCQIILEFLYIKDITHLIVKIIIDGIEYEAFNTSGGVGTLTETFWSGSNDSTFIAASGSLSKEQKLLENDEIAESLTFKLLKEKIDELVKKVNELS